MMSNLKYFKKSALAPHSEDFSREPGNLLVGERSKAQGVAVVLDAQGFTTG